MVFCLSCTVCCFSRVRGEIKACRPDLFFSFMVFVYIYIHTHIDIHMCIYIYIYIYYFHLSLYIYIYIMFISLSLYIYTHVCIYIYICICIHLSLYYIYIYIYIYVFSLLFGVKSNHSTRVATIRWVGGLAAEGGWRSEVSGVRKQPPPPSSPYVLFMVFVMFSNCFIALRFGHASCFWLHAGRTFVFFRF